ncbi:deoxyribonuclease-1 [Folsomia candida]|uniref:deoxyribonuclease-1 n=1 Tax=Folsomia candida TaxID=158441 RepID=UPI000B8F9A4D|nr:deoxyribonuclease-1 [Folsomia candida]
MRHKSWTCLVNISWLLIILTIGSNDGAKRVSTTSTRPPPISDTLSETMSSSSRRERMLIGAFNMRKFGLPKIENEAVLDTIIKIVKRYDVIALSEITDRTEQAVQRLMEKINLASSKRRPYHYIISDRVGRTNNKEQYALVFRSDMIRVKEHFLFNDSKADSFAREPHIIRVNFQGYDKDVVVINIHVKPTDAVIEIDALTDVQNWVERTLKIRDVIMLGDFNADCGYVPKKAWKNIRLRNMEQFNWLIGDEVDTTVGKTNCAYDRIVVTGPYFSDGRVIPHTAKAFQFDNVFDLNETNALQVSDHYPVEISIAIGRPKIRLVMPDVGVLSIRINKDNNTSDEEEYLLPDTSRSTNLTGYGEDESGRRGLRDQNNSSLILESDSNSESAEEVGSTTESSSTSQTKSSRWTKIVPEWARKMFKSWF